jgi:hypothetical protein
MEQWLGFSYSLSTKGKSASTARVMIWRRLRRIGAIAMTGSGLYVLPDRRGCLESFQWLAQEINQSGGEAAIMRVHTFENLSEVDVIKFFHEARAQDYAEIAEQVSALESQLKSDDLHDSKKALSKIQSQHESVMRTDYFNSAAGSQLTTCLDRLAELLAEDVSDNPVIDPINIKDFKGKTWVTRPQPHVDRLSSAWLIRRFIDPEAKIRYAAKPQKGEISFDFDEGAFTHVGNLCTFEVMIQAFGLNQKGLAKLAEIVHDIDLQDGRYVHAEASGIDALLHGWLLLDLSDAELEVRGLSLFESLYTVFSKKSKE